MSMIIYVLFITIQFINCQQFFYEPITTSREVKHFVNKRDIQLKDECKYESLSHKLNDCADVSNNCNDILKCIDELKVVEKCEFTNRTTPFLYLFHLFNIIQQEGYCDMSCDYDSNYLFQNIINLIDNIQQHEFYDPYFLDTLKQDNKLYCEKSQHFIAKIQIQFQNELYCQNENIIKNILNRLNKASYLIFDDNKCLYCTIYNLKFDDCLERDTLLDCNTTIDCFKNRTNTYKCNLDSKSTILGFTSNLIDDIKPICELNSTHDISMNIWLRELNQCLKKHRYLGLAYKESPLNEETCQELDSYLECIEIIPIERHFNPHEAMERYIDRVTRYTKECYLYYAKFDSSLATTSASSSLASSLDTFPLIHNTSEQTVFKDSNDYYTSHVIHAKSNELKNWIDIDSNLFKNYSIKRDDDLSRNYLKASVVKLTFKFPYYGHLLEKLVIATGGFIYVGNLMHPLITKAQYIAPLMANFDPKIGPNSMVKYVDNTTHFICTWENLFLQDQIENGEYTFQVVLDMYGTITFNYFKIPTARISSLNHNVKIGISDAYVYSTLLNTNKVEYTIFQYHNINISLDNLNTGNTIIFTMMKNCIQLKTCSECIQGVGNFKCIWCSKLQRCSDLVDRYRQEWIESSCPTKHELQNENLTCTIDNELLNEKFIKDYDSGDDDSFNLYKSHYIHSALIGVFITVFLVLSIAGSIWAAYAYTHPNTTSGIWLIEHRPSRIFNYISSQFGQRDILPTRFGSEQSEA